MATDNSPFAPGPESPAINAAVITPNDGNDLVNLTRGIYVGVTGDVAVDMQNGQAVTFVGVQGGSILPIRVKRVKSSGTTASSLVALF